MNPSKDMSFYKKRAGYTLFETILTIVLVVILSVIMMPSLRSMLTFLHSTTTASLIKKEIFLIRSRALADPNLHTGLFLDTTGCPDSVFTFFDDDHDNYFTRGTDRQLNRSIALPETDTLIIPPGYPDVIIFRGNGSAKLSALFVVKKGHKVNDTLSVLASTGRIKLTRGTN